MPYKDPEYQKRYSKDWRDKNLSKRLAYNEQWKAANPEKVRAHARKNKTGWTQEEFDTAWMFQNGKCAICRLELTKSGVKNNSARADHDHRTGRRRGLLCNRCNTGLGFFEQLGPQCIDYLAQFAD